MRASSTARSTQVIASSFIGCRICGIVCNTSLDTRDNIKVSPRSFQLRCVHVDEFLDTGGVFGRFIVSPSTSEPGEPDG